MLSIVSRGDCCGKCQIVRRSEPERRAWIPTTPFPMVRACHPSSRHHAQDSHTFHFLAYVREGRVGRQHGRNWRSEPITPRIRRRVSRNREYFVNEEDQEGGRPSLNKAQLSAAQSVNGGFTGPAGLAR